MDVSSQLLFFFSSLGVFNGLIICIYFIFFKKPRSTSDRFFAFLLLMLVIRVGKSVFYYFNDNLSRNFLQIGLTACFLIGPAVYLYIKSVIHLEFLKKPYWKIHITILIAVALTFGIIYPYATHPEIWYKYIIGNIYNFWTVYILIAGYVLRGVILKIFRKGQKINALDFWLLSVYFGNAFILIAYRSTKYTSYIVGALSFTFIFYILALVIYLRRKNIAVFSDTEKYSNKNIENAEKLIHNLELLMRNDKPFKNPKVKIKDIADSMGISSHMLSQLLNDNLGKSFRSYINEYRIIEAKQLLTTNDNFTLEAIGLDAGFSSKSSFYATFKKVTEVTPAQFKRENS